ncbi:hypothetical protein U3A58_20005 [Algoriphagus sp. C2-6-M1]|uniref:hypothetical protein n=1 Tax=Algoriphagus persicinus TaxID=3108754 RepID=UPI002B3B01DE|nr:hypothetical protein [Algoriphagus sp. C2-6-M1]MEB2782683.1 hypothetical protein [Algoriphagus sp. C2-6-M1]
MQTLIANYSTPAEFQRDQYLTATVHTTARIDRFKSPSLSIFADNQIPQELRLNNRIFNLLEEFSDLRDNWDEDGAIAPTKNILEQVYFIVQVLTSVGQNIFTTAPGPNGEIMIDIRGVNNKSVELIFYQNRSIAVYFPENGKPTQEDFQAQDLPAVLRWLNQ